MLSPSRFTLSAIFGAAAGVAVTAVTDYIKSRGAMSVSNDDDDDEDLPSVTVAVSEAPASE